MLDLIGKEQATGLLRHLLTAAGPLIAAQGWASSADIETAGGALIALIGVLWSVLAPEKKAAKKARKGV